MSLDLMVVKMIKNRIYRQTRNLGSLCGGWGKLRPAFIKSNNFQIWKIKRRGWAGECEAPVNFEIFTFIAVENGEVEWRHYSLGHGFIYSHQYKQKHVLNCIYVCWRQFCKISHLNTESWKKLPKPLKGLGGWVVRRVNRSRKNTTVYKLILF